jgi:peptidoglycan/LPS O-acetylase OafA/YrhL
VTQYLRTTGLGLPAPRKMSNALKKEARQWRADIDGLRAIAVLSVVAYHAMPSLLTGGFVGVDVFFVISGYLITGLLLKEHQESRFSLIKFYERRARRIFPALAVVLAVTVLIEFAVGYPAQVASTSKYGVASALSLANIALWRGTDYFDTASNVKPFLHLWSLGVEEQFYLVWPLLLAALVRTRFFFLMVAIACLASLASSEMLVVTHGKSVFYLPWFRAWELGLGCLLAMFESRGWAGERVLSDRLAEGAASVGVMLIVGSAILLTSRSPFPGLNAVAPVAGSALVIWAGSRSTPLTGFISRLLASRPFVYIGLISYALYLWHWPLLSVPITAGIDLGTFQRLTLVVVAFVLSALTFRWIETPARHAAVPRRATVLSCVGLLAACSLSVLVYFAEAWANSSPERQQVVKALEWQQLDADRSGCPDAINRMEPTLVYCRTARAAPPQALVWGDSHADSLYPGLVAMDPDRNWMLLGHFGCPPVVGIDVVTDQLECRKRAEEALRWIEQQSGVDTVVLGLFGHYADDTDVAYEHTHNSSGPSNVRIDGQYDHANKAKLFTRGLDQAVGRLVAAKKRVLIVIDVPELPFLPDGCFTRPRIALSNSNCLIPISDVAARQKSMRSIFAGIAAKYPGVTIVDPLPAICGTDVCGPGTSTSPIYRDSHHLSRYGSSKVAQLILEADRAGRDQ